MVTRGLFLILIAAELFATNGADGRIVGRVTIEPCAPLGGALVWIAPDGGGPTVDSVESAPDGRFVLEHVKPGVYKVRAAKDGYYRESKLHGVVVSARATVDLGRVWLMHGDCDDPNVHCGCVGDACRDDVSRKGRLLIKRGCGADLDAGVAVCDADSKTDIRFSPGEGKSLYIRPTNGASMAPVDGFDARISEFSARPVRVDGLSPGASLWVHTASGHSYSHLVVTEDLEPDSAEIDLWYVNGPDPPRPTFFFVDGLCPEDMHERYLKEHPRTP